MNKIVRQLSLLLDLPLPPLEASLLTECVNTRMQNAGIGEDYEAYEQLLQLEEREVSLLLCEIIKAKANYIQNLKQDKDDSEHELSSLQTSLENFVYEISADYHFLNIWTGDVQALEKERRNFLGKTVRTMMGNEFADTFETIIDKVIDTKESQIYEYISPLDQNWYIAKTKYLSPKGNKGKRVGVEVQNIHSRKSAEQALIVSEKKYRFIYHNTPVMLHSADKDGNIIDVSDYWLDKMGYTREEVLASKAWSFLPPEDQDYVKNHVVPEFKKKGFAKDKTAKYRQSDGVYIDILVNSIACYDDSGEFSHSLTVCTDISEHIKIKEALLQSEKRYKVLIDHSPHAILVHSKGKLLFANDTAVRLLGSQSLEELAGVSMMEIVHPEEHEEVKRRIEEIYSQSTDTPLKKCRFVKRDNSIIYVEAIGCMIEYEGKQAIQVVFRDISLETQVQNQLKSQEKLLKGANEANTYLLNEEDDKVAISKALRAVLIANEVDRAYIFENHTNLEGVLCVSQRFEVVSDHATPEIDNPEMQNLPYKDAGLGEWLTKLEKDEIVSGPMTSFSQGLQEFLEDQKILSIILIPIFIKERFWGIFGLDDCTNKRSWSCQEAELLRNTANSIGNFMVKKQIEDCESLEHGVSRILSITENAAHAVKQILEKIGTNLNWDIGELWIPNNPPTYLSLEYGWHNKKQDIFDSFLKYTQSFQYQFDEGIVGKAYNSAQPVWITGLDSNSECRRTEIALKVGVQSCVAIPIVLDNTVLGVLCLLSTQARDLNDIYIRTFTSIGIQIGQYIKRKRAENQFKNIVDTVPAVVWRFDVEAFAYTYVSHQAETMLGFPVENWIGNASFWLGLIHPDDREYAKNYCAESTAKKMDHEFEYRMINSKGEIIWISDHVHVIVKNDKAVELVGFLIDITEQKKAERALKVSEERLKLAIEGAELGLWDWNIKDDTVYLNKAMAEMLEYTLEEMPEKFKSLFEWIHPDDVKRVEEAVNAHLMGKTEIYQDELRLRTKSGNYKWLLDVGKLIERDKDGTPLRMLGVHRDIHQRKSSDEQLRISEERLRLALKGIGICDWNIKTDTFYLNESWELYMGYEPSEINSTTRYFELIHPEEAEIVAQQFQEHMEGKTPYIKAEMRMRHKDGHYIWVLDQGEVVEWDENGAPLRLVSTHLDISEIKNYQQKIQELNKDLEARVEARTSELKASNEDLENFAYSISHDLRAPLRHINGYSRLLSQRSDDILDENTKEFVGFIADAALKLSQQIEDLLQYSRIGRREIKVEEIDLEALIRDQITALEKENPNRQIEFKVSSLPHILGDALLVEQLFYNLLSNAVKYTGREATAIIEVGVAETSVTHSFYVRDNGVGFDPTYSDKLFKVFKRLHGESEFEGTGIGLANVYRIVQRHYGRVWGESTPGEGATFYVSLPNEILERLRK